MVHHPRLPRLATVLVVGAGLATGLVPAAGAPPAAEGRAEGRYPYLAPTGADNPLVARWAGLARAMPDWKEKNKAAHYRFAAGKDGRRCDQKECHPGFRDAYVDRLLSMPEGPDRQAARERRHGLDGCGDCHTRDAIWARVPACRLHYDRPGRLTCTSCHLQQGARVLVMKGPNKTIALRKPEPVRAWPGHELTRDEKGMACDKTCHVPENPFEVAQVCSDCHGPDKLEVARYTAPGVLVHATDQASLLPGLTSSFFAWLTGIVAVSLLVHILLDVVRSWKEAGP